MKYKLVMILLCLCFITVPVMASEEEPTEGNALFPGDNIWIAISPIETHPLYLDRPAAIIPLIPGYPIRVAVYSNPYLYPVLDSDGVASVVEVFDPNAKNPFSVSQLGPFMNEKKPQKTLTLRLPDENDPTKPAASGVTFSTVHMESEYKYQFVFYVRDFEYLDPEVDRLFLVAENEDKDKIVYQGSGVISIKATSQKGGGSK